MPLTKILKECEKYVINQHKIKKLNSINFL